MGFFTKRSAHRLVLRSTIGLGLTLATCGASASNFQSFAGINYSNPADLFYIVKDMQFVLGGSMVIPIITFNGTVHVPTPPMPGVPPILVPLLSNNITTTGSSSNLGSFYMPYGRFAKRLNDQWIFGVDVTQPFREDVEYSSNSAVSYATTKTIVNSMNVAPNIAYKFGGSLSNLTVGVGFDAMYFSAELDQNYPSLPAINVSGPTFAPFGTGPNVNITNYANDWAYGWHIGATYHLFKGTFLSASYFSGVRTNVTGTSTFSGYPDSQALSSSVDLPATSNFTVTQFFSEQFLLQARVFYSQWDSINAIVLNNIAGPVSPYVLPTNYRNTWRFELRSHYDITQKLGLQALLGYDQTPSNNVDRTLQEPETNRYIVGGGAEYKLSKAVAVMFNYAHAFSVGDVNINNVNPTTGTTTVGTAGDVQGNLFELRLTVNV